MLTQSRLDSKHVFSRGFADIRTKVNQRFYVSVFPFVSDLTSVIRNTLREPILLLDGADGGVAESTSPSKQVILKQKERKTLAKRIIKAIQPQLEAVARSEADVTKISPEHGLQTLIDALENCTRDAVGVVYDYVASEANASTNENDHRDDPDHFDSIVVATAATEDKMDVDDHDQDAPGEEYDEDADEDAPGEEVDDEDVFAPVPTGSPETVRDHVVLESPSLQLASLSKANGPTSSDTPPDTNGYVSSASQPPTVNPPTPPVSNGDLNTTISDLSIQPAAKVIKDLDLSRGGVPWYMEKFQPQGMSVVEPEADDSDELSEMDEDEVRALGEDAEGDVVMAETKTDKKKNGRAKRRWKGFR
jgi:NuA3 HAT complex component NTO1